ncbi:hypothetical protein BKA61DRAFT_661754 [Leptodontidium sp. MPI-SDFR-AT-0119]|nr:hypothetical protein BKA61DRAFT_661754 [Leptodontidium sp. MPI-SDFR-AT-0119]
MLYSMLPAMQSRLPRLPSHSRSVSMYGLGSKRKGAATRPGARTWDGGYTSAMVMSSDDFSQAPATRTRQTLELSESKSGIGWKFAHQASAGLNLLNLPVESSITRDANFGNASFVRQRYLHALIYLLQALPSDLTTEEQLSVRSVLPQGVVEPLRLEFNNRQSVQFGPTNTSRIDQPPSLLHRTLAYAIVQLFILFQFVLPYLKVTLRAAYHYERMHKISEKVLS